MAYPLGNFDPNASLNDGVVAKAKAFLATLPSVPPGLLTRIYYHWTVAPMGACFDDYNGEARLDDAGNWVLTITHDPRDNAPGIDSNPVASHTYMRNTGALGAAITGMDGAGVDDHNFGPDGVTVTGLHHLCALGAAFATKYGIDAQGLSSGSPYGGEPNILTHAEAANRPGFPAQYTCYGPPPLGDMERWDLATLTPLPAGVDVTNEMATTCGDALRLLTHRYKVALAS